MTAMTHVEAITRLFHGGPSSVSPIAAVERLGIIMDPQPGDPTEAWGVLNPAVVRGRDGELYLFARVVAEGNVSRIRAARVLFDAAGRPIGVERLGFALEPEMPYERRGEDAGGCEDPRVTYIPLLDLYVMAYTAYGPSGARVALAVSADLHCWQRLGPVAFAVEGDIDLDAFDNKDAFFFPEPVVVPDGTLSLVCMHRPMSGGDSAGGQSGDLWGLPPSIWVSYVPVAQVLAELQALTRLGQHRLVMRPEHPWEHVKVGGGAPPIPTEDGWLLVHHGIDEGAISGGPGRLRYSAGAFVVDRDDVTRVLWRSSQPLLVPETEEELRGEVNDVVFPTGVDVRGHAIDIYYGMADSRIGVARAWLRTFGQVGCERNVA